MEKLEIGKKKVEFEKAKPLAYRVYKKTIESKKGGRPFSFESFDLYEPIKYTLKVDRNGKRAGETDIFRNTEFNLNRIGHVLQVLHEIDLKYNEGKGFHSLKNQLRAEMQAKAPQLEQSNYLGDDDIPF